MVLDTCQNGSMTGMLTLSERLITRDNRSRSCNKLTKMLSNRLEILSKHTFPTFDFDIASMVADSNSCIKSQNEVTGPMETSNP